MDYIRFGDRGYKYFDEGDTPLFCENNPHELLFQYVARDLSRLPELFNEYVSRRMDVSTFELHDCSGNDPSIDQIKSVLIDAHPYYEHKFKDVFIRVVGIYFNALLLYSCYNQHTVKPDFSKEWYMDRITALMAPFLKIGDIYSEKFYIEYQEKAGNIGYTGGHPRTEIEVFAYDIPQKKPTGFRDEIETQRKIYNMLYFLLDISAQGLNELTPLQRTWFYSNIVPDTRVEVISSKYFPFKPSALDRIGDDDKFRPLYALGKLNVGRNGIPDDMGEAFYSAIGYAKTITVTKPYEEYEVGSLHQLLCLEIWTMLQDEVMIRKCRHCGKYFIITDRKVAYCDRVDESGMCCSAIGSQESFKKKMEADEALQIYNRAYKTHHARVRKGIMSKDAFQLWCKDAKLKLAEVRNGKLEIARFQEWVKE